MGRRGEAWVAVQALFLIVFAFVPRTGAPWSYMNTFRYTGGVLAISAIFLLVWSAVKLGRSLTPFPRPVPGGELVTTGAYRFVRHPIYCGIIVGALGLSLLTGSFYRLALTAVLFIFFDLKARREEEWLMEKYSEYGQYRLRVKKIIPWLY